MPQCSVRSLIVILSIGFVRRSSFKDASSAILVVFAISFPPSALLYIFIVTQLYHRDK